MKKALRIFIFIIIASSCVANYGSAQHEISINLSIKVILDSLGNLPPGYSDFKIEEILYEMNQLTDPYHRGFKFVNKEIVYIGGVGTSVTNKYSNVNVGGQRDELELDAEANPTLYEWRENRINIYINSYDAGLAGACSFSSFIADEIIFLRPAGLSARTFIHEIGHFFDLSHTHNGAQADSCKGDPNTWVAGDDGIDDTLPDHNCWNRYDQMAQDSYGKDFDELTSQSEIDAVVRTFENMMSYHGNSRYELTEIQLDRIADALRLHSTRRAVTSGEAYFVAPNPGCGLFCFGYSDNEFEKVDDALLFVDEDGGDIIIYRQGTYDVDANVISQPVFMKATRAGDAVIK